MTKMTPDILRADVRATVELLVRRFPNDYAFAKGMISRSCGWDSPLYDERQFLLAIKEYCERTNQ